MKRGMVILLFILLLACSVSAMTVTLVSPTPNGIEYQDINSRDVVCKVEKNETEELTSLTVYYENNESTTWQAGSTQDNPVSTTEYTFSLSSLVNATYTWNCLAVNNESNEQYADSNLTFKITFTEASSNTAPSWQQSTNQSTTEDSSPTLVINLDYDSSDTEDDALSQNMTYSISESASSIIDCSVSGAEMSCGPPAANKSGDNIVTVTATDSGSLTASIDYNISVMPVNDAPLVSVIANQTWNENANKTIDLADYFSDVEDSDSSLNYSYTFTSSSPDINVTIESDGDAIFTPESDWTGTEKLTFTATDSGALSITSNEIILTVEESNTTTTNTAPSIDSYLPGSDPTISVGESQTFTITKTDPEGDSMNVTWKVDNSEQEGKTGDSFKYTANNTGSFKIKVVVVDNVASDVKSATHTWILTVKSAGATTPTAAPSGDEGLENETFVCGDGTCDSTGDEDCVSCPDDCACPEGFTCHSETKKCTREKKSGNTILLIVIISLFVGGAGAGVYFYKKKREQDIFGLAKTPFKAPPKEEIKSQRPAVEIPKTEPKKPSTVIKGAVKKPAKPAKTTSQVLLKKFITYNLKKGKSFKQIKKELLKVGWTADQIDDAYTAARLDEAFS